MKVWKKQKGLLVRTMICAVSLAAACFYGNSLPAQAAPRAQETGERVVIVIDPGHGGDNEGTLEGPAQEKKMTMVTALAMYEELTKYDNVDVYLTHTDDVTMSLADRAQFAADRNADFLFSIHYNASVDHDLFGSEVWISSVQPYNAYGYQFGWEQMQQMQDMGLFLRGVKTKLKDNGDDYYGIIRESTARSIPSAIIEHCHVDESRDTPYCQTEEDWKKFGREDALSVAKYFGLSSASLGVDYSGEADALPEVSLQSILPATVRDKTEPDICQLTLQNADYETGEVSLEVTAADYDCPMMYYDYSTDGGRTYSELLPWPGLDIMAGTYPDTFTFSVTFTKGEQPVITVRGYNQADLFTESDPVTFAQPFIDQEKAAKEALQESLAAQEAAEASRAAEEQITEVGSSVITMADAAGNTPVPSEKSPEVNFGVFLVICGILVVLLLLVFLLYQIQQSRHRKRRRKNQSRKVSGDNRNHPR
ncbi:Sporulation-specific N-acetylmuramoyl-L-alanine amidase [uncultured Clostridium sp.]|jgi:N-acetylmuramoyl-L-alanine amidase|uniref:N-acetylmuramoyl-L-alanine amidase family protein n=1 Tax=Waltera sp. TaxID=2815806 RepID=UPI0008215C74|nr:N-acetylmuramoyl-L-alanine amidase [Lachnospiraceae bacterium]SCI48066.1 Sporulation-specific N-acetylmuramoyl-L-alanine amidase [uncultured Clostridium sp.]